MLFAKKQFGLTLSVAVILLCAKFAEAQDHKVTVWNNSKAPVRVMVQVRGEQNARLVYPKLEFGTGTTASAPAGSKIEVFDAASQSLVRTHEITKTEDIHVIPKASQQNPNSPQGNSPQGNSPQGSSPQGSSPQGSSPQGSSAAPSTNSTPNAIENEVLRLVNEFRAQNNRKPIVMNAVTSNLCREHSKWVCTLSSLDNTIGHKGYSDRISKMYDAISNVTPGGENVAIGSSTAAGIVESWKNSKAGHREAMLFVVPEGSQGFIGVGFATAPGQWSYAGSNARYSKFFTTLITGTVKQ